MRSYHISSMQAAEGGDVEAKFIMGISGENTQELRMKWLHEAAGQGHTRAQETLARQLEDPEEASSWHRKAAENGSKWSQYELAALLDPTSADGHSKDAEEAMKWYREAAKQGNVRALEKLGLIYSGTGVKYEEMRQAVGLPEPQPAGAGVNNNVTAYAFFSLSAYCDENPGRQFGAEMRDELVQKMSSGQLKGAHQLKGAQAAYQELLKQYKERQSALLLEMEEARIAEETALIERAEGGDAKAQLALGWKIIKAWDERGTVAGSQGEENRETLRAQWEAEEALRWWRKAADQGDPEAQSILSVVESD